jgi:hypothetical protein
MVRRVDRRPTLEGATELKKAANTTRATNYVDRVIETHAKHGFGRSVSDDDYVKAVTAAQRLEQRSSPKNAGAA